MRKNSASAILPAQLITQKIYFLRGIRVMLDSDLVQLYGVTTKNLNKAVKRIESRFPVDFIIRLKPKELQILRFQSGTSSSKPHGGRRYLPYAFTEHGVTMLSSVLHSDRAVQLNFAIMRAFVQIRSMLASQEELRRKIAELEKQYDSKVQSIFTTLRLMLETPIPPKRQIGFHTRVQPFIRTS